MHEIEHRYGPRVHVLDDVYLSTLLAQLCSETTKQPVITNHLRAIYTSLLRVVAAYEFPKKKQTVRTRMAKLHPEGEFQANLLDPETPVATLNLARAGTLPSQIVYEELNSIMNPDRIRQDHISIARATNDKLEVIGSTVSGHKIGGKADGSILLIPDPMGATGSTIIETLELYKTLGKPLKIISLHCIITPEYLKKVLKANSEVIVYALRLDRGLSPPDVLKAVPGEFWDRERGLNANDYIVPGGGGFGEILNNAYV